MTIDDLAVMGPIFVLKLRTLSEGFPRKLVTELWLYPDGRTSSSCRPSARRARRSRSPSRARPTWPARVDLGGKQQTKTKTALEYFAGQLEA